MKIKIADKFQSIDFIQKYHYSKVLPKLTKHYLGLFEDELVGVITLGWGTQPKATIKKVLPDQDFTTKNYFEIGKMCIHPDMPKNTGTRFLSMLVRWLKQNTNKDFLYTLADGIVGKIGYMYQAFNFYYGGYFKTDVYIGPTGEKLHQRTIQSAKNILEENREFLGTDRKISRLTPDFMKFKGIRHIEGRMFRYMKPLNKDAKKVLDNSNWQFQKDYPKKDDLVWREQIEKGKWIVLDNMPEFHLDVVDVNEKNVHAYKEIIERTRVIQTFFKWNMM